MTTGSRPLRRLADVAVGELRHVSEKRAASLEQMGITTVFDLITTYPRRYVDRTRQVDLSDLNVGEEIAIFAEVKKVSSRRTQNGKAMVEATVSDGTDTIKIVFFNQVWRERQLPPGTQAMFFGKVTEYRGARQMTNPVVDVIVGASGVERDPSRVGRVVPIYPASGKAGFTSWEIGGFVEESLRRAGELSDPLEDSLRQRHDLVDRSIAFRGIHAPAELGDVPPARRRLVFDEFLRLQLLLALRRARVERDALGIQHHVSASDIDVPPGGLAAGESSLVRQFLANHRFALTGAQRRALTAIFTDLGSIHPMHRLLQGDVGSGKTVVALTAMLAVIDGGRQAALMAPTEVLAEQHVASLRSDLEGLTLADERVLGGRRPINVLLLSGKLKSPERRRALEAIARGDADIIVGTHALITDDVEYRSLGLVIIDEQHRFGVEQRAALREKGRGSSDERVDPDLLVMTATPIPRTAALMLFGDLDSTILDEMPQGRRPVLTSWARSEEDEAASWQKVRDEVAAGRRAFVVCPLVEGSEKIEAASAVAERDRLEAGELNGLRVGLLHGQMKDVEKEMAMERFRRGDLQVLVATTVIEVGVDVPEATVMVIEDAWRFGIAQLHQLRGRVGRSSLESFCFLFGEPTTPDGNARLEALVRSTDGFYLAEVDLELRGEGTILGSRQRGRSDLKLASLARDKDLLELARDVANELVATSPSLSDHPELIEELRLFVDEEEAAFLFKS